MGYGLHGLSEVVWGQCTLCLLKTVLKYSLVVDPWCQQHVEMCSMAFKSSDWEGEDHDAKLQEMLFQPKSGYCGHMYWEAHCHAEKGCAHLSACKSWTGGNDSEECICSIPWWVWSTDGWRVLMPAENALHQNIAYCCPQLSLCWHAKSIASWSFLNTQRHPSAWNSWNHDLSN